MEFSTHGRHPPIIRLAVHDQNEQFMVFREGNEATALDRNNSTTLTAWMDYNAEHPESREYLYDDFPQLHRWDPAKKKWFLRKKALPSVGRLYATSPAQGERHYLRMLLHHIPGATSFQHLKTLPDGTVCDTYQETAVAMGLLEDDSEWDNCLTEAATYAMPFQMRQLFATVLVYCHPADPAALWHKFKGDMGEDYQHQGGDVENRVLLSIEQALEGMNSSLRNFPNMPLPHNDSQQLNLYHHYDIAEQEEVVAIQQPKLNREQTNIYNEVLAALDDTSANNPRMFVINSPGGCGKTYLFSTILAAARAKGIVAVAVAPTGLAAENLEGGRTAHSFFKIPIPICTTSVCNIKAQSMHADLIRSVKLIVWDEVMATHRYILECVDRSMQDIRQSQLPFGNCVILCGGDSRQILPVVRHGSEADIINACINSSPLWPHFVQRNLTQNMRVNRDEADFAEYVLAVGEGRHEAVNGKRHLIRIPDDLLKQDLQELVDVTFPNLHQGYEDPHFLAARSILTTLNKDVDEINRMCGEIFPGDGQQCYSADKIEEEDMDIPTEYLNSITPSGFPPHVLHLKPHMCSMLLRNLQAGPRDGLRNGTRMMLNTLGTHMIECEVITGQSKGATIFLPRIPHVLRDSEFPFTMVRKQFPIRPSFAMTINKSQGQTLDMVGLYLKRPVFAHGQLYVALSHVRSKHSLSVVLSNDAIGQEGVTANIVYRSVL